MKGSPQPRIRKRVLANMSVSEIRDPLRLLLAGRGLRKLAAAPGFRIPWRYPYRGREEISRVLGPDLAAMTTWAASNTEPRGQLAEVFSHTPMVQTLAHYLPIYESLVDGTKPIRMLEIGGFYGGSLQMWREYLHPGSLIVGIDADSKLLRIADSEGTRVRIGAEQEARSLRDAADEFGPFDVILDSGSHTSSHMVDSFRCLFANALRDSGVYIVADVDCDYRTSYRDSKISFIDLVRALIDAMHSHYQVATSGADLRTDNPNRIREVSVPAITPMLGSVEIRDSVVVVRRAIRDLTQSIRRP